MDRRKSIKTLFIGGVSISVLAEACNTHENSPVPPTEKEKDAIVSGINRMKEEIANEKMLSAEPAFFTAAEMATITILGDIIIPRDPSAEALRMPRSRILLSSS